VNSYAAAAGRVTGSKIIGAIRSDLRSEIHSDHETLRRWGAKLCCKIAANSAPAIRTAIECGIAASKLTLLPNVVDTCEFHPADRPLNGRVFTLASVGRLVPAKRHDRMLSLAARLKRMCAIPIKLLIAGDGPCRNDLENQVERLALRSAVEFLGTRDDLPAIYKSVHAVAITSDYEGTPNVALEAMACGLPVVSTRVGGIPDIVEHGVSGLLAEREDETALASHLYSLANDRELREALGANARRRVVANHSVQRLPKYLEDLYTSVLSN
jgi:glycosyltransferase involved in cell wall biosynthesis